MRKLHNALRLGFVIVIALAWGTVSAESARATILTFNIDVTSTGNSVTNGNSMLTLYPDYGDNVNSLSTPATAANTTFNYLEGNGFTPNVTTSYAVTSGNTLGTWDDAGGSWTHAVWRGGATPVLGSTYFTFTPDPPFGVAVNSFDLQHYGLGGGASSGVWRVRADSIIGPILSSGSWSLVNTNTSLLNFDTSAAGAYAGTLVLEIEQTGGTGGSNGYAGIDNINFDQLPPVPEPATATLLLLLGALGVGRSRRRQRLFAPSAAGHIIG